MPSYRVRLIGKATRGRHKGQDLVFREVEVFEPSAREAEAAVRKTHRVNGYWLDIFRDEEPIRRLRRNRSEA